MSDRAYQVIDVFTREPFAGNFAAVVLDAEGLSDERMQAIAAEFNVSETTFVLPAQDDKTHEGNRADVRFRWFAPAAEVNMCGHATIAGVHALLETGRLSPDDSTGCAGLRIETRSGLLTAVAEPVPGSEGGRMIWLQLRPPTLRHHPIDAAELAGALRISLTDFEVDLPTTETQDQDLIVFVKHALQLAAARPIISQLAEWLTRERLRGLSLATVGTLTPSISLQSRFFAPTVGIDEDPVTGSVHGPLAAFLVRHKLIPLHDGVGGFMATQGIPGGRTGLVSVLVEPKGEDGYSVRIGGEAVTTMRGVLIDQPRESCP